jgi:hypothetical protein
MNRPLFLALVLAAAAASAQDRFEIQVYDTEVAQPGEPGLELNLGVGRGFGEGDAWVAKAIIGVHPQAETAVPSGQRSGASP